MALCPAAGKTDDDAPRAAELALQRLHALGRHMKVLLEEPLENVHEGLPADGSRCLDKDSHAGEADARRARRFLSVTPLHACESTPSKRVYRELKCIVHRAGGAVALLGEDDLGFGFCRTRPSLRRGCSRTRGG